jgi:23S rRNA (uracil1939-C5)-methyltransferase
MLCPSGCPGCLILKHAYNDVWVEKTNYWQKIIQPQHIPVEYQAAANENRLHYRKKTILHVKQELSSTEIGLMHRKVLYPIDYCMIHDPALNNILSKLKNCFKNSSLNDIPFSHVILHRRQLLLVIKAKLKEEIIKRIKSNCHFLEDEKDVEGFHLHFNPSAGDRIIQKNVLHTLWGERYTKDEHGFYYSPLTFTQHLWPLVQHVIQKVLSFFDEEDNVLDLFCGTGITSYFFQKNGFQVTGIENNPEAIQCATQNSPQSTFLIGKTAERLKQLVNKKFTCENIYLNPPRSGLDKETFYYLLQLSPTHVAYLSCNPKSLKKDLQAFLNKGYRVTSFVVYDFFPFTRHVETLALLEK